jgi:hypothetical protein
VDTPVLIYDDDFEWKSEKNSIKEEEVEKEEVSVQLFVDENNEVNDILIDSGFF